MRNRLTTSFTENMIMVAGIIVGGILFLSFIRSDIGQEFLHWVAYDYFSPPEN